MVVISNWEQIRKEEKDNVTPFYETLYIIHPDEGGKIKEIIDRYKDILTGQGGTVSHVEEWGLRELAYRIGNQAKGYYVLFQYSSSARAVEELERNMKLADNILRFLTVRLDEEPKPPVQKDDSQAAAKNSTEGAGRPEQQA